MALPLKYPVSKGLQGFKDKKQPYFPHFSIMVKLCIPGDFQKTLRAASRGKATHYRQNFRTSGQSHRHCFICNCLKVIKEKKTTVAVK